MSRVVIDTSVLISALIGKAGPSREVIQNCLSGNLKPLISTTLFLEYEAVAGRPEIRLKCPLTDFEIDELIAAFVSVCEWISISFLWRPNLKDEADNFLVALAVAGNANMLITNNIRDFKGAELRFQNLKIVSPEQILRGE